MISQVKISTHNQHKISIDKIISSVSSHKLTKTDQHLSQCISLEFRINSEAISFQDNNKKDQKANKTNKENTDRL